MFLDFDEDLGEVVDLVLDDGSVARLAVAWDDDGVFVAELVEDTDGDEPAHCRDACCGIKVWVET